ncbi:hypothetical protein E2562_023100 [Oryza meyeriana var. granulata]|uniref:Uncharacterized protein n=1 Tax=Oryza meyeriana var. granulata TaxID=110450 RepID=A0A6G1E0H4_9ORYZ|nr:hypothetical protein E2562_023100 [Oryza meyeriana var. granulata]
MAMFDTTEARRSKAYEEMDTSSIKATTSVFKAASSPPPTTSPALTPTKCSMECPNNGNTCTTASLSLIIDVPNPAATICFTESSNHVVGAVNSTPTKCSMNCTSPDVILELTVMVIGKDATGITYIDTPNHLKVTQAKCTTIGLGVKDHAGVVFLTMIGVSEGVPAFIEPVADFAPRPIVDIKPDTSMPTWCSVTCHEQGNTVLIPTSNQNQ